MKPGEEIQPIETEKEKEVKQEAEITGEIL
jgi:hypothetical protein